MKYLNIHTLEKGYKENEDIRMTKRVIDIMHYLWT